MKKLLLSLGTVASITAPLVTVVACGNEDTPATENPGEDNGSGDGSEDDGSGDGSEDDGSEDDGSEGGHDLSKPLQINGQNYIPEIDRVIMMKDDYNDGTFWNNEDLISGEDPNTGGDGAPITDEYVEMDPWSGGAGTKEIVQMGANDSVVVVYDADENDGAHVGNFEETVAFARFDTVGYDTGNEYEDSTSIKLGSKYVQTGNTPGQYADFGIQTFFKDGKLLPFFGAFADTGDLTIQETMKLIATEYDDETFATMLEHYGYLNEKDANGDFLDDPNAPAGATSARGRLPAVTTGGIMSYEQIAANAIKITYNYQDDHNWGSFNGTLQFFGDKTAYDGAADVEYHLPLMSMYVDPNYPDYPAFEYFMRYGTYSFGSQKWNKWSAVGRRHIAVKDWWFSDGDGSTTS